MKELNLSLDLSRISDENPDLKKIWEGFIIAGARTAYKDGIDIKMQSRLIKIIDKIELANDSVQLEDAEYDVLKEISERAKFDPAYSRIGFQIGQKIAGIK